MSGLHRRRFDTIEKIVVYAAGLMVTILLSVFVMLIDKYMDHEKDTAYQIAIFNFQIEQLRENVKGVQNQQTDLIVKIYSQSP